jgi:HK97 family phage prohead protease
MLTKAFSFELKELSDAGTFTGYASVYGNVDQGGDMVIAGAFAKSMQARPTVPILYQHNQKEPIGLGRLEDTADGLLIHGELVMEVPSAKSVYALMRKGVLKGLSIGYKKVRESYDRAKNANVLQELALHEVSVVTFPANERATIMAVKSRDEIKDIRNFEEFLRESGFSRTEACVIASKGWKGLQSDSAATTATPDAQAIAALIQSRTNFLKGQLSWN